MMLLLGLIHLNETAAIIQSYPLREMFIFSVFGCVLYLVQCSSDPNASLCSNRNPPPTHTLHFSSKL